MKAATVSPERAVHEPFDCPKYDRCSVPICPLDKGWHKRGLMDGEPICPFLRELDKPGTAERFAGRYEEFVIEAAERLRGELVRHPHPRYAYIVREIANSAATPSMIERSAETVERFRSAREKKVCTQAGGDDLQAELGQEVVTLPAGDQS